MSEKEEEKMFFIKEWQDLLEDATCKAVEIRRKLHQCPEPGGMEYETVDIIHGELKKMNLIPRPLMTTGMCAFIPGGKAQNRKRTLALRADMDGLPIGEETGLPFASAKVGWMHACGHDIHMAVLLGTAWILSQTKKELPVNVQLIFQPNEENEGGARDMIAAGALHGGLAQQWKAEMILGFHVLPDLPIGNIGIKYGKVHAASEMFFIKLTGKESHGAMPHKGVDAITGAAQMILATQIMVSRELSPVRSGLITFGKIKGGQARNVLAAEVHLEGIIRGEDRETCLFLKGRLLEIFDQMAKALLIEVEFFFEEGYPALINDTESVLHVQSAVRTYNRQIAQMDGSGTNNVSVKDAGTEKIIKIHEIQDHTMTVDDFAYYLQEIPGAYFFIGSGPSKGLHTSQFVADERCIKTGIATLVSSAYYFQI